MAHPVTAPIRVPVGKTAVPQLPAEFTSRPALLKRLDAATGSQIIVLSAPAGSGKTLLLADWVRQDEGLRTAWISLDADDNDPRRLWSAVVASLLTLSSTSRSVRLQRVAAVAQRAQTHDLVEELADALDAPESPVRVPLLAGLSQDAGQAA